MAGFLCVVAQPGVGERRRHQPEHDENPEQVLHLRLLQKAAVSATSAVLPAMLPLPSWPLLKLGRR